MAKKEDKISEIKSKINTALELLKADNELFSFDVNNSRVRNPERAISHRLGCYLQPLFNDLKVDCEYNKHMSDPKRNEDSNLIIPDIVIHMRKVDKNNLLVIEIKTNNDECGIKEDVDKLKELTRGIQIGQNILKYDYGLFILFQSSMPSLQWFENGREI